MTMRTIKFNGKCISPKYEDKIACGSLLSFPNGEVRIFEHDHDKVFNYYSVDPATACQFTGLLDKNGKEIYEGDVLRSDAYPFSCTEDNVHDNYYGVIGWSEAEALFCMVAAKNPKSSVRGISDGISDTISQKMMKDFEVIGNVHDDEWKQYREYIQEENEEQHP